MAADCKEVAEELRKFGVNALEWDSGGGMVGVGIAHGAMPPDELLFFFGTAGEFWAGEVLDDDGEVVGEIHSDVSSGEQDARRVAAALLQALAGHARRQAPTAAG